MSQQQAPPGDAGDAPARPRRSGRGLASLTGRNFHYLFDFVLMFLAVFCGFMAENYRQSLEERGNERQYMQSLVEDLQQDIVHLQSAIEDCDEGTQWTNQVLLRIVHGDLESPDGSVDRGFMEATVLALPWLQFSPADRTATQLKNGGNMRLIRNRTISDAIVEYWHSQEVAQDANLRYQAYRWKAREVSYRLFTYYPRYMGSEGLVAKPDRFAMISRDPALLGEYANYLGTSAKAMQVTRDMLVTQRDAAAKLVTSIRAAYRLH